MSIPGTLKINDDTYVSISGDNMAGAFARLLNDRQAQFFNDVGAIVKLWDSYNYGEPQWCMMARDLNEDGKALLRSMVQFLDD